MTVECEGGAKLREVAMQNNLGILLVVKMEFAQLV